MTNLPNQLDSSGKGEPAFCAVLRQAIRAEFGSSKAFARHVGISESRTSQLLSGAEIATAPTLAYLLEAFPNVATKTRIQEAWVRSYAPSPVEEVDRRDLPEVADRFLASLSSLTADGRSRPALRTVTALARTATDRELRFRLTQAAAELSLILDRPTSARQWAAALGREAKGAQDLSWIARSLYLDHTVARATDAPSRNLLERLTVFQGFLANWSPQPGPGRVVRTDLKGALARDRALTALKLCERRPDARAELADVAMSLDRLIGPALDPVGQPIFLEVSGRVHLALGDIARAEDRLEEAATFTPYAAPMQQVKTDILTGQVLLAKGNRDQARPHLLNALDRAYDLDDLHHARTVERLLGDVERGR